MREVAEFVEAMQGAFEQDAPIQVFRNLIQDAPVVPIDEYYTLALSFVAQNHPRPDVLRVLLEHEPEIAKFKNDDGFLLLHSAIHSKASVEAIELILDANPQCAFERWSELTPLHLACESAESAETVELLLSRYPGTASISGGPGANLPVHVALTFKAVEHTYFDST